MLHTSFTPLPTPHTHYYAMPMVTGKSWELVDMVAGWKPAGGPFVVQGLGNKAGLDLGLL